MELVRGWRAMPASLRNSVVAIGNFDGVHRGHRVLIERAKSIAQASGGKAGVIVFTPHPREYFNPGVSHFHLSPLPVKLELLEECGLDFTVVLDFDEELAQMEGETFVKQVLAEGLGVSHIVIGHDFAYGKGRTGDPEKLAKLGETLGFGVEVVAPVCENGLLLSSGRARDHLRKGEVRQAAKVLGDWWRIRGTVEAGAGRGKGLGFPTLNFELEPGQELAHGIYAVRALIDGKSYDAAGYLGKRPTFDDGKPKVEAYLFDFDENLYGKSVELLFIEHIREDRSFETPEALAEQMTRDCEQIAEILRAAPKRLELKPL